MGITSRSWEILRQFHLATLVKTLHLIVAPTLGVEMVGDGFFHHFDMSEETRTLCISPSLGAQEVVKSLLRGSQA
jgi:hypothetical protein